jgi:hypothetical protein
MYTDDDIHSYCSIPLAERSPTDGFDYSLCNVPTNINDGVEVYEGEFVTSEGTYNRISYNPDTGKWHGVSYITDINVMYDHVLGGWTRFDIKFSRDIEYLDSVYLKYTTQRSCFSVLGVCMPWSIEEPDEEERTFTNTQDDDAWHQGQDEITYYGNIPLIGERPTNQEYDYSIKIYGETRDIDTVMILEYNYILTNEEIIQLALDIQDQYDYEVGVIANDDTLTTTEKNILLNDLNVEYGQIPDLTFGMMFSEECLPTDENCIEVLPVTDDSTAPSLDDITWDSINDFVYQIIGGAIAIVVMYFVGLQAIGAFLELAIDIIVKIGKGIAMIIYTLIIDPIVIGVTAILNFLLSIIFWW